MPKASSACRRKWALPVRVSRPIPGRAVHVAAHTNRGDTQYWGVPSGSSPLPDGTIHALNPTDERVVTVGPPKICVAAPGGPGAILPSVRCLRVP